MYRMHRVFCATSWELEGERLGFYATLGDFNEEQAMQRGILYVPVSLLNVRDKRPYQYLVEENLRDCRYCLVALSDGWGPPERTFERDYQLALRHAGDPGMPMKGVELLVRENLDGGPGFRADLAHHGIEADGFVDVANFQVKLRILLTRWLEADADEAAAGAP